MFTYCVLRRTSDQFSRAHRRAFWWEYGWSCVGDPEAIWDWKPGECILICYSQEGDWDSSQIFAFMLDNASNNDMMVNGIQSRAAKEGIHLNATWAHLWCMPHTIHLAAIKVCGPMSSFLYRHLTFSIPVTWSHWCGLQDWGSKICLSKWQLSRFNDGTSQPHSWWWCCSTRRRQSTRHCQFISQYIRQYPTHCWKSQFNLINYSCNTEVSFFLALKNHTCHSI